MNLFIQNAKFMKWVIFGKGVKKKLEPFKFIVITKIFNRRILFKFVNRSLWRQPIHPPFRPRGGGGGFLLFFDFCLFFFLGVLHKHPDDCESRRDSRSTSWTRRTYTVLGVGSEILITKFSGVYTIHSKKVLSRSLFKPIDVGMGG